MLSALKAIGAGAVGAAVGVLWGVTFYGPAQYEAGGLAKAAQLDAATQLATKELANEADRAAFLRRQCLMRRGLYDFASGRCVEGQLE